VEVQVQQQLLHEPVRVLHQHDLVAQQALAVCWVWEVASFLCLMFFGVSCGARSACFCRA
jgi:hypothetical protein